MCTELETTKARAREQEERLRTGIEEREHAMSGLRSERDSTEAHRDKLESTMHQKER